MKSPYFYLFRHIVQNVTYLNLIDLLMLIHILNLVLYQLGLFICLLGSVDRRKNYGGELNIEVSWYNLNLIHPLLKVYIVVPWLMSV